MIWLVAGVLLGALPGFHPNLALDLSLARGDLFALVFGSLFSSVIPAMLMVPTGEMAPVLLPGQEAVREGRMQSAVGEFAGGALLGALLCFLAYPAYRHVSLVRTALGRLTLPFLVFTATATLLRSRRPGRAALVFLLSGLYGLLVLGSGLDPDQLLGAHFSAMFGVAGLLTSSPVPRQESGRAEVKLDLPAASVGFLGGLLISLFPAITPAQAYAVMLLAFGASARGLAAAGSLATSSFLLSFQSLLFLGKGRMAPVEVLGWVDAGEVVPLALLAYALVLVASGPLAELAGGIPRLHELMLLAVLASIAVFYRQALPVAAVSLLWGLVPGRLGIERVHLMGSLIVPTMLWYL